MNTLYWTCEAWHILIPANVPASLYPYPLQYTSEVTTAARGMWHCVPCPPLPPANFPGLGNVSSTPPPAILPGCWLLACRPLGDGVAEDIGLVSLISRVQQQPSGIVITWYLASYRTYYQEQCYNTCMPSFLLCWLLSTLCLNLHECLRA